MRSVLFAFVAVNLTFLSTGQNVALEWVTQTGGTDSDRGLAIDIGPNGNIYTGGDFNGIVDFDPGSGTFDLNAMAFEDGFIQICISE